MGENEADSTDPDGDLFLSGENGPELGKIEGERDRGVQNEKGSKNEHGRGQGVHPERFENFAMSKPYNGSG